MRLHLVMMTYLSKLGHFYLGFFSETKSATPLFGISNKEMNGS